MAMAMSRATASSASRICCSCGSPSIACCSVTGLAGLFGTSLQMRSTRPEGISSTGQTSRDAVAAVFLLDVAEVLVAPVRAEVDVEIRQRHALGIEEALEQQAEAQRVEIGDGERPGDDRAGARAAPRPDGNARSLRPLDELRDDEEISREAHLDDDVELEVEPLAIGLRRFVALGFAHAGPEDLRPQPQIEPVPRHGAQLFRLVAAARRREG